MSTAITFTIDQRRESIQTGSKVKYRVVTRIKDTSYTYENATPVRQSLDALPYHTSTFPYTVTTPGLAQNMFLMKATSSAQERVADSAWVGTQVATPADLRITDPRNPSEGLPEEEDCTWGTLMAQGRVSTYRAEGFTDEDEFIENVSSTPELLVNFYYDTTLVGMRQYNRSLPGWLTIPGNWRGEFAAPPVNPVDTDPDYYFNTTDGILYYAVNGGWEEVDSSRWLGELAVAPDLTTLTPDAYYNVSTDELMVWNEAGNAWAPLIGVTWYGERTGEPVTPEDGDWYFDLPSHQLRERSSGTWSENMVVWRGLRHDSVADIKSPYQGTPTGNYYISSVLVREFDSVTEANSHALEVKEMIRYLPGYITNTHSTFSTMNNAANFPLGWESKTL